MKPANIMLVPAETAPDSSFRAVITDFGLARLDTALPQGNHSPLSHSGRPIGTLAYMAPEQLEGTAVSAATDIYAFGLTLFEMVTGTRAFPTNNFLSGIAKRLSGPPPSPSAIVPDLPASWCSAIDGCLRLNPANRFQSAIDVVAVLEGRRTNLPRAIKPTFLQRLALTSWPSRRRFLAFSGVLCAVVALFFGGYRLYQSRADSKVNPGALVYLTQVRNLTGERSLDNLTELLQAELGQSAQINLLDQGSVVDILQLMKKTPDSVIDEPLAREVAMRTGAARVIFATVTGSAGSYRIAINIQQPDATSPSRSRGEWQKSFPWNASNSAGHGGAIPQNLLAAVRDASDWIRLTAGESHNDIARLDIPPEDVTTGNWEALSEYTEAKRLQRESRLEDAVIKFKGAIQADPQFALAYASMGDALVSLHRELEGYAAYDKGLDTGLENRLSRKEEDRIRGMRAVDTADYELAVDTFRDLAVNYPADVAAWVYPAFPLRMLNRDEEAIVNLRRAVALDPDGAFAPYALAQELMIVGRFQEVPQWIAYLKEHHHPDAGAEDEAVLAFLNHEYNHSERIFQSLETSPTAMQRSYSYQELASEEAETGRLPEAIEILNRGIVEDISQNNIAQRAAKLLARAYLECKLSRFDTCLQDVHSGFALSPTPEHALTADTVLGEAFAASPKNLGQQIRSELAIVARSLPEAPYGKLGMLVKLRTQGDLQLTGGLPKVALRTLENAAAQDAPAGSREYLARAFIAVASQETDEKTRTASLRKAETAYAAIALRPAFVFMNAMNNPPGVYADELASYLSVAQKLKDESAEVREAQHVFNELPQHGNSALTQH